MRCLAISRGGSGVDPKASCLLAGQGMLPRGSTVAPEAKVWVITTGAGLGWPRPWCRPGLLPQAQGLGILRWFEGDMYRYRGTPLIRNTPPVGPCSSPMPRDLW